eukprot:gene7993-10054_t
MVFDSTYTTVHYTANVYYLQSPRQSTISTTHNLLHVTVPVKVPVTYKQFTLARYLLSISTISSTFYVSLTSHYRNDFPSPR